MRTILILGLALTGVPSDGNPADPAADGVRATFVSTLIFGVPCTGGEEALGNGFRTTASPVGKGFLAAFGVDASAGEASLDEPDVGSAVLAPGDPADRVDWPRTTARRCGFAVLSVTRRLVAHELSSARPGSVLGRFGAGDAWSSERDRLTDAAVGVPVAAAAGEETPLVCLGTTPAATIVSASRLTEMEGRGVGLWVLILMDEVLGRGAGRGTESAGREKEIGPLLGLILKLDLNFIISWREMLAGVTVTARNDSHLLGWPIALLVARPSTPLVD